MNKDQNLNVTSLVPSTVTPDQFATILGTQSICDEMKGTKDLYLIQNPIIQEPNSHDPTIPKYSKSCKPTMIKMAVLGSISCNLDCIDTNELVHLIQKVKVTPEFKKEISRGEDPSKVMKTFIIPNFHFTGSIDLFFPRIWDILNSADFRKDFLNQNLFQVIDQVQTFFTKKTMDYKKINILGYLTQAIFVNKSVRNLVIDLTNSNASVAQLYSYFSVYTVNAEQPYSYPELKEKVSIFCTKLFSNQEQDYVDATVRNIVNINLSYVWFGLMNVMTAYTLKVESLEPRIDFVRATFRYLPITDLIASIFTIHFVAYSQSIVRGLVTNLPLNLVDNVDDIMIPPNCKENWGGFVLSLKEEYLIVDKVSD